MVNEKDKTKITVEENNPPIIPKRKRMSKKERKELKKARIQQHQNNFSELDRKIPINSNVDKRVGVDDTIDYLENYVPITSLPSDEQDEIEKDTKSKDKERSLGKWFPMAKVLKSDLLEKIPNTKDDVKVEKCSIALFYQYATPLWSQTKVDRLLKLLVYIGKERKLGGRLRVAREGINATVSSIGGHGIRHLAEDLKNFDLNVFGETDFKFLDDLPLDRHFKDLKVYPVQEIVYYGIKDCEAPLDRKGGVHLDPADYHEKLKESNTVVIDVRNHYEAQIGRFDGQEEGKKKAGAEYIDPFMRRSTDFPEWLAKEETQKKLEGKQVLMYCTGGVRCERASAYLNNKIGDKVKGVYQLKGGIEKYFKEFPDGGFWRGKNFVFDKREAVAVTKPDGDGGVVRKMSKSERNHEIKEMPSDAKCCVCGDPWDRFVGKKKCYTCHVPILMCPKCMSVKPDKTPDMVLKTRCPLCVKENITKPNFEVTGTRGYRNEEQEY